MPSKNTILFSLFWKFMERIGTQGVQLIISIVLARLLAPEEFGLIALVMVIIVIADVFVQSGLGTALIRGKNTDDEDFSSVFWAGIFIAAVLYITIFAASPKIADFYGKPALTPVIRVLTLSLFLGAFGTVQNAYIARNMLFKKLFYRGMAASIPSGILGIVLAYLGFGVWALVFQQLANSFLSVLTLWFAVPWKPHFKISFVKLADLFSFGWKLLVSSLISNIYEKLRSIVIGKMFSAADLAFLASSSRSLGDFLPFLVGSSLGLGAKPGRIVRS
jgi:O-antigen/teichoic acid export membrane protein